MNWEFLISRYVERNFALARGAGLCVDRRLRGASTAKASRWEKRQGPPGGVSRAYLIQPVTATPISRPRA
jgi:hypothetical protein